jgi:hypothetical protein
MTEGAGEEGGQCSNAMRSRCLQVGIVMERQRQQGETDHLRWYCDACCAIVYEESFFCTDLGSQLKVHARCFPSLSSPPPPPPPPCSPSSSAT